jgi:hypothetical protein
MNSEYEIEIEGYKAKIVDLSVERNYFTDYQCKFAVKLSFEKYPDACLVVVYIPATYYTKDEFIKAVKKVAGDFVKTVEKTVEEKLRNDARLEQEVRDYLSKYREMEELAERVKKEVGL